ncbi:MAG: glucosaminidase domain-containing protein [Alphaproteobacteria bacterium]|nr:glucosaminidase domain-containing protein [Alphaproteobacteria bacterium]
MWGSISFIHEYKRAVLALVVLSVAAFYGAAIAYPVGHLDRDGGALPYAGVTHVAAIDDPMIEIASVFDLGPTMDRAGFVLKPIRRGDALVPRLFVENLPEDFNAPMAIEQRKQTFIRTVLPLILKANEEVRSERGQLMALEEQVSSGLEIPEEAQLWLDNLAEKYRASSNDFTTLLRRVDTVSPTLALAQSIEESGWGRSRFSRLGNALYGQRVWSKGGGFVPEERGEEEKFEVRAFDSLFESVRSYVVNLNRHYAYEGYRAERSRMRSGKTPFDGRRLSGTLISYSERREAYVESLAGLIEGNRLWQFENAQLSSEPVNKDILLAAR